MLKLEDVCFINKKGVVGSFMVDRATFKNYYHDPSKYGRYNGYIIVNKNHALFGCKWQQIEGFFDVHGGITYSDYLKQLLEEDVFLRYPQLTKYKNCWVFGFHTACSGDNEEKWNYDNCSHETKMFRRKAVSYSNTPFASLKFIDNFSPIVVTLEDGSIAILKNGKLITGFNPKNCKPKYSRKRHLLGRVVDIDYL